MFGGRALLSVTQFILIDLKGFRWKPICGDRVENSDSLNRSPCCARVARGHAAAAPPSSVMKSRRLPRNSIRKRFGINDLLVSSILVRSAHGNSFDHLVGAREQPVRNLEAERLCGLEIDH